MLSLEKIREGHVLCLEDHDGWKYFQKTKFDKSCKEKIVEFVLKRIPSLEQMLPDVPLKESKATVKNPKMNTPNLDRLVSFKSSSKPKKVTKTKNAGTSTQMQTTEDTETGSAIPVVKILKKKLDTKTLGKDLADYLNSDTTMDIQEYKFDVQIVKDEVAHKIPMSMKIDKSVCLMLDYLLKELICLVAVWIQRRACLILLQLHWII